MYVLTSLPGVVRSKLVIRAGCTILNFSGNAIHALLPVETAAVRLFVASCELISPVGVDRPVVQNNADQLLGGLRIVLLLSRYLKGKAAAGRDLYPVKRNSTEAIHLLCYCFGHVSGKRYKVKIRRCYCELVLFCHSVVPPLLFCCRYQGVLVGVVCCVCSCFPCDLAVDLDVDLDVEGLNLIAKVNRR